MYADPVATRKATTPSSSETNQGHSVKVYKAALRAFINTFAHRGLALQKRASLETAKTGYASLYFHQPSAR